MTFQNRNIIHLIPLSELLGSLGILRRGRSIAGARERLLFVPSRSGLVFMLPFPSASFPQSRMFGKLEAFLLSLYEGGERGEKGCFGQKIFQFTSGDM